jgi:hypothetical protein
MPCAQKVFLPFLEQRFPELVQRYRELYAAGAFLGKEYKDSLRTRIAAIRARHGLTSEIPDYRPEIAPEEQGSLDFLHLPAL